MTDVRCDGLWKFQDQTICVASIVVECDCSKCQREGVDGRFHACADLAHQESAARRHVRTYDRSCRWVHIAPGAPRVGFAPTAPGCGCVCHRMPGVRHVRPCCKVPPFRGQGPMLPPLPATVEAAPAQEAVPSQHLVDLATRCDELAGADAPDADVLRWTLQQCAAELRALAASPSAGAASHWRPVTETEPAEGEYVIILVDGDWSWVGRRYGHEPRWQQVGRAWLDAARVAGWQPLPSPVPQVDGAFADKSPPSATRDDAMAPAASLRLVEQIAALIEDHAAHYPTDVFSEDGQSSEAIGARMARHLCRVLAEQVRAMGEALRLSQRTTEDHS